MSIRHPVFVSLVAAVLTVSCSSVGCCHGRPASAAELAVPRDSWPFTHGDLTKTVYELPPAPDAEDAGAVVVLHELPGLSAETFRLGRLLSGAGLHVYLPLMFGEAGEKAPVTNLWRLNFSSEWSLLDKDDGGEILPWLAALCAEVSRLHGGDGIGVVGMCLSGSLPIALLREPAVVAPVVSQPSLPLCAWTEARKAAAGIHASDLELAKRRVDEEGIEILAFRFELDDISPPERLASLADSFGDGFLDRTVTCFEYSGDGWRLEEDAHSVLTAEYCDVPGHPSKRRVDETIAFLKRRLAPAAGGTAGGTAGGD